MFGSGYKASAGHFGPNELLGCSVVAQKFGVASAEAIARNHGADKAEISRLRRSAVVVFDTSDGERLARSAVAFTDSVPRNGRGTS